MSIVSLLVAHGSTVDTDNLCIEIGLILRIYCKIIVLYPHHHIHSLQSGSVDSDSLLDILPLLVLGA